MTTTLLTDDGRVYRRFDAATKDLSAWAIIKGGEYVAKIVTKYSGRTNPNGITCTAYVHVLGLPMACARTGPGGGYDMKTDAIARACRKLPESWPEYRYPEDKKTLRALLDFRDGLKDQGYDIPHQLRGMGYEVCEVM